MEIETSSEPVKAYSLERKNKPLNTQAIPRNNYMIVSLLF